MVERSLALTSSVAVVLDTMAEKSTRSKSKYPESVLQPISEQKPVWKEYRGPRHQDPKVRGLGLS